MEQAVAIPEVRQPSWTDCSADLICPKCKATNSRNADFCRECGYRFTIGIPEQVPRTICPKCHNVVPKDKRCHTCGEPFSEE